MAASNLICSNHFTGFSSYSIRVNRRRQHLRYTVYNDISVSIHFPDGRSRVANLLDLSISGAYAVVFSKPCLRPCVGQRISMALTSRDSDLNCPCAGTIRHVTQENLFDFNSFGIGLSFDNELPQCFIDFCT